MRDGNRTPSPKRASKPLAHERSPWTAQRVRKKGRKSPEGMRHLPKLPESGPDLESKGLMPRRSADISRPAMLNPFLRQLSMPDFHDTYSDDKENFAFGLPSLKQPEVDHAEQVKDPAIPAGAVRWTDGWESSSASSADERKHDRTAASENESMHELEGRFLADKENGLLLLQRTPLREVSHTVENAIDTPSPRVAAPGIRQGNKENTKAPPKVPSSCRTIRRVLVDSPVSSRRSSMRGEESRDVTRDPSPYMSPFLEGNCRRRPQTAGLPGASPQESPRSNAQAGISNAGSFKFGSPEFALSRGRVTPNNLVPSWDDDLCASKSDGSPASHHRMRSIDFRERHAGSALDGEQAWHDVRSGDVKPDDIDTLNALLKEYCKVKGDPEEAEQVVKEALQGGRITANASTYHHMATLWTQYDQLNNRH